MKIIGWLFFLLLLVGVAGGSYYVYTSPQYSVYQMFKAVNARDYNSFTKYYDTDAVVSSALSDLGSLTGQTSANLFTGLGSAESVLTASFKAEVQSQIENGQFGQISESPSLLETYQRTAVNKPGSEATVTYTSESGEKMTVMMRDKGLYWQVFAQTDAINQ